jgi:uncharacterized protein
MDRHAIIIRLRESQAALRQRGVRHAALFGSCAGGETRPDSDVDIMIEIDPARIGLYRRSIDARVDVVRRDRLKPYVRPAAARDAIYAF